MQDYYNPFGPHHVSLLNPGHSTVKFQAEIRWLLNTTTTITYTTTYISGESKTKTLPVPTAGEKLQAEPRKLNFSVTFNHEEPVRVDISAEVKFSESSSIWKMQTYLYIKSRGRYPSIFSFIADRLYLCRLLFLLD